MEKDYIKELNDLRKDLEISKRDFIIVLSLAIYYQKRNEQYIKEEELYQIVEETLVNMDYENEINDLNSISGIRNNKTIIESFERALNNLGYDTIKRVK